MIIVREGIEIRLTPAELRKAYEEQEKIYSIQNIKDNMSYYLDPELCENVRNNEGLIRDAAERLIRKDNHFLTYGEALRRVFDDLKKDMIKEE